MTIQVVPTRIRFKNPLPRFMRKNMMRNTRKTSIQALVVIKTNSNLTTTAKKKSIRMIRDT